MSAWSSREDSPTDTANLPFTSGLKENVDKFTPRVSRAEALIQTVYAGKVKLINKTDMPTMLKFVKLLNALENNG